MSIVRTSLSQAEPGGGPTRRPWRLGATVRAMEIGQHVIAAVLTAIGVVRAIGDGVPIAAAVVAGIAILAWHTAGAILLARPGRARAGSAPSAEAAAPARSGSRRASTWWLLGFAVVWIAAVAVSAEFVWVAFLLWLLAGHLLPGLWAVGFSVVVFAVVVLAPVLHHGSTDYPSVFGPLIGGVFALGISRGYLELLREGAERDRLVASLERAQQETTDLQDELALAQRHSGAIAERTRLSRDIHDTIAQGLSSIRLIALAEQGRTADAAAGRAFRQLETIAGDSLADVRRIVAALAPAELDDDALATAVRRMLDRLHDETGIEAELHVDESLPLLPTAVEVALLRTAQSALANTRLHASATRVVASLIDAGDAVRLDIIDDGVGFDVAAWEADEGASSSYGLRFMRTRLRELGGGLDLESTPGEGAAISAHLPIHQSEHPRPDENPVQP